LAEANDDNNKLGNTTRQEDTKAVLNTLFIITTKIRRESPQDGVKARQRQDTGNEQKIYINSIALFVT
jgi:hypothetical protein